MSSSSLNKMRVVVCAMCLCVFLPNVSSTDEKHSVVIQIIPDTGSPIEFPKKSDSSTPILIGNNPKLSNLPPKMFPNESTEHNSTGPPILSGTEANFTEIKNTSQQVKVDEHLPGLTNKTSVESKTKSDNTVKNNEGSTKSEQDDMLHSKYKGGQDVDEILSPEKKGSPKEEKKTSKKDLKGEIDVSPDMDKKGPKLMSDTKNKSGESMLGSTSEMMAVSSSVLSNTTPKHQGIIEPLKTFVSLLMSVVVILSLGVIGLLVWRKIAQRRHGRDVLINEDDFDEVADMHTFDTAQIQIT